MWIINFGQCAVKPALKLFLITIVFAFLHSEELGIDPIFTYGYESDSEEYHLEDVETHDFEVGIIGSYSRKKLNIQTYLTYHLIHGPVYNQSQFTPVQGLHWIRKDPGTWFPVSLLATIFIQYCIFLPEFNRLRPLC